MAIPKDRSMQPARARLEARVAHEQKALFERAAAIRGQSLTDFLIEGAQKFAEETIKTHEIITLTARDTAALIEALRNPPPPTDALAEAFALHRKTVEQRW